MIESLSLPRGSDYTHKLVVYVPEDVVDRMREALAEIGVGVRVSPLCLSLVEQVVPSSFGSPPLNFWTGLIHVGRMQSIGTYKQCSFSCKGSGSWFATDASNPGTSTTWLESLLYDSVLPA